MMEPTETESKETLDAFADRRSSPSSARNRPGAAEVPRTRPLISRPDEVKAAKEPVLRWATPAVAGGERPEGQSGTAVATASFI